MAHTLLEQEFLVKYGDKTATPMNFLINVLGMKKFQANSGDCFAYPDKFGYYLFKGLYDYSISGGSSLTVIEFLTKKGTSLNMLASSKSAGSIFYHISEGETVKYFKYVCKEEKSYTYILAQDENGEWVVFNGDKMYSDYGETGIYNNPQIGRTEIVDGGNQFIFSQAARFDTGTKFKELYFVLSAKSYVDTNCIVQHGDKKYRLVSVSNAADETGRFPAFAFPVSD